MNGTGIFVIVTKSYNTLKEGETYELLFFPVCNAMNYCVINTETNMPVYVDKRNCRIE